MSQILIDKVASAYTGTHKWQKLNQVDKDQIRVAMTRAVTEYNRLVIGNQIIYHQIRLNLNDGIVYFKNKPVPLGSKSYQTLKYFMLNKGKVISQQELSLYVWEEYFDKDSTQIRVMINNLRKLFPNYIQTCHRAGYTLNYTEELKNK